MHKRRQGRVRASGVSSVLHSGDKLAPASQVENLSLGGVFLRTPQPMREGSPVVLDLVKPGLKKAIRLTGRVVSTRLPEEALPKRLPPGMGVQFDPYPKEVEARLQELLASIAPGPMVLEGDLAAEPASVREPPLRNGPPPRTAQGPQHPPRRAPELFPEIRPSPPMAVPESARLMVQVKGLLMELADWQSKVDALERENQALREELQQLRAATPKR